MAQAAANWLAVDWQDDQVLPRLLDWEQKLPVASMPPWLVCPGAPWNIPGPLRHPLRLPVSVYERQARMALGWLVAAKDPKLRASLVWWLGIHQGATFRAWRSDVIAGLARVAGDDPDPAIVDQAKQQLKFFLGFDDKDEEGGLGIMLSGDFDDHAALAKLDALADDITALLAKLDGAKPANPGKPSNF